MTSDSPGQALSDELVEAVARAICDSLPYGFRGGYGSDHRQHTIAGDPEWHLHKDGAGKVMADIEAAGYAVVPLEPTEGMAWAAKEVEDRVEAYTYEHIWDAMLAARPRS